MRPPVEYPEDGKEYRWDEEIIVGFLLIKG
jgi:hypothetical protein